MRWNNPEIGFVPPDQFISIAEQTGLMKDLGDFIIDRTLSEMSDLQHVLGRSFSCSINISVRQLAEPDFTESLLHKISASGLENMRVALEITENLLIDDLDRICGVLKVIHDAGIRISLDDFGTGYSSLSILRYLPLDEIKIDKSFVDDILNDETALRMVKNIIAIGRNYGVTILAEGVETEQQFACLSGCGCDFYQGYLFSKPVSKEQLLAYLQQQ